MSTSWGKSAAGAATALFDAEEVREIKKPTKKRTEAIVGAKKRRRVADVILIETEAAR